MSTDARQLVELPAPFLLHLTHYLHDTRSGLTQAEAIGAAIEQGLVAQRGGSTRGYQWKCLFLPAGSELRVHYAGQYYFAQVIDNDIIYEGRRVTPRQLTLAIAGDGRNAWRDLWVRLAGEKTWKSASVRRREIEKKVQPAPASPIEAMSAAAACMSQALKTALALVEHSKAQALPGYERRMENNRRTTDKLFDEWKAD